MRRSGRLRDVGHDAGVKKTGGRRSPPSIPAAAAAVLAAECRRKDSCPPPAGGGYSGRCALPKGARTARLFCPPRACLPVAPALYVLYALFVRRGGRRTRALFLPLPPVWPPGRTTPERLRITGEKRPFFRRAPATGSAFPARPRSAAGGCPPARWQRRHTPAHIRPARCAF